MWLFWISSWQYDGLSVLSNIWTPQSQSWVRETRYKTRHSVFECVCSVALVMSASLQPYRLQPTRLLCPWDFPGKNTGMGCHALLQGIFLTQGSNLCLLWLLHCWWILYPVSHRGSPTKEYTHVKIQWAVPLISAHITECTLYFKNPISGLPGGSVVKTPHFQRREYGFNPWSGN